MLRMQDAVETVSNHGAVYFQEILPDGVNVKGMPPRECSVQNQIMVNATKDERIAKNLALSATLPGIEGEQCLQSQMGMTRFIVKLMGKNPKNITRLKGLLYPGRRDYLQRREQLRFRPNVQLLQEAFVQDLMDYNAYTTDQIIGALPDKGCGFLLTGGTHFEANTDIDELLTWDDTPRNIRELMLDSHLYAIEQLNDTNIFILEPNHYATVPRFDRTGQLVRPPSRQS